MKKQKVRTLITRIFGQFIPPRKSRAGRDHHFTIRFVLVGTVPAKKNNQIPVTKLEPAARRMELYLRGGILVKADGTEVVIPRSTDGRFSISQVIDIAKQVTARIVPSNRFQAWHADKKISIDRQMKHWLPLVQSKGLIFPLHNVSMKVYHHWNDLRERDLSNRLESIQDLFTDCQLIADDNDQVLGPVEMDAGRYKGEILDHVTVVHLTAYY